MCVCVTCALISQATDEAPLLQQQSVQQNQVAPGVGFQPWVQHPTLPLSLSSISHPSFTQPAPTRGTPYALQPLPLPLFSLLGLARCLHLFYLSLSHSVFALVFLPMTPVLHYNGNDFHAGLPRSDIVLFWKWLCSRLICFSIPESRLCSLSWQNFLGNIYAITFLSCWSLRKHS